MTARFDWLMLIAGLSLVALVYAGWQTGLTVFGVELAVVGFVGIVLKGKGSS